MSEVKILKKCNFCRSVEELNTEDIPFWSKKMKIIHHIQKWFLAKKNIV